LALGVTVCSEQVVALGFDIKRSKPTGASSSVGHELALATRRLLGNRRFSDARDFDLIQTIVHIRCGNQVAHRGFQRFVPHPVLNSPYIKTLTQHPRCVSGSKGLQIERRRIETGSLGDGLAEMQHILFAIAGW
jgi:hypothetical protein